MSLLASGDVGLTAIDTVLVEEANRIGQDIHARTLHTSPWIDLVKQTAFPDGMGFQLTTLVYDRAVSTSDLAGGTASSNSMWSDVGAKSSGQTLNSSLSGDDAQPLADTADDIQGSRLTGADDAAASRQYVNIGKQLKEYNLKRAVIESPRISLEDLRFAAHRTEQLRAIMDVMTEVTRNTWENRYREEFDRLAANITFCMAAASKTVSIIDVGLHAADAATGKFEGAQTVAVDLTNDFVTADAIVDYTPDANISNAVLDSNYFKLIRAGAGNNAYGRENGRPVFALVCSSEASYQLQTEAGFRDDVRYNNAKVSDLIAPLGIEKSFRGFYHLVDDLAPRYTVATGTLTRVQPYAVAAGVATPNAAYETATHEVAFIMHPEVMESQIPNPFSGAGAVKFNPVSYKGDFKFLNILDEIRNPDGSIGFFRGVLASASKPIKTDFGYVVLFKRDSSTPAAGV
jgi:hypothetical protein